MSNVTGIRGQGATPEFDPDNVLQDEPLSASAFDRSAADEDVSAGPTHTPPPAKSSNKLVFIAVAVVAVSAVIYSTVKPILSPSPSPAPSSSMTTMQAAAAPPANHGFAAPPPTTMQAPSASPYAPAVSDASAMATTQADTGADERAEAHDVPPARAASVPAALTQQVAQIQAQLATLQTVVAGLQSEAAQRAKAAADQAAARPAATTSSLKSHAGRPKAAARAALPARTAERSLAKAHSGEGPKLKAVLVGQAWFETAGGRSLAVATGDTVPGYGRITSINADAGEVHFADGTVVR